MDFEQKRIEDLHAGLGQFISSEMQTDAQMLKACEIILAGFEGAGEGIDISNEAKERTKQYFNFVRN